LHDLAPGLLSFDTRGADSPSVIAQFEADRDRNKPWYVGVVRAGTRMRFVRVVRFRSTDQDVVRPFVVILDGPFAGKEVSADAISKPDYTQGTVATCIDQGFIAPEPRQPR